MQDMRGERQRRRTDFPILGELPKKNIDTGLGVERVAFLLQGVDNVYETDLLRPIITGRRSCPAATTAPTTADDVRFRVIADHIRSARDADRRRRHARQRGPRLRAAPAAAPHRPLRPAARRHRAGAAASSLQVVRDADGPVLPGAGHRLRAHPARRGQAEEETFLRTLAVRLADLRHRRRRDQAGGRHRAARRQGVPAARHLRLPDRPDAGDGRRGRADRRRGRVPPADGRAAAPGQGRRAGAQGPATAT